MAKAIYLLQVETNALFGYNPDFAKMPGMVVYDPEIHGYRKEVAHVLGLEEPKAASPKKAEPRVSRLVLDEDGLAE